MVKLLWVFLVWPLAGCTCSKKPEPAAQHATPAAPAVPVPAPAPAPRETLRGVWGSSAKDIWSVGNHGTILHYDGAGWSDVPSGTELNLGGVSGSAADDVWAAGDHGVILHFDGKGWQVFDPGHSRLHRLLAHVASGGERRMVRGRRSPRQELRHASYR